MSRELLWLTLTIGLTALMAPLARFSRASLIAAGRSRLPT